MATVNCEFCKKPLRTDEMNIYQWTSGWVKQRSGGGGHGVSLPERSPRWAHSWCVDSRIRGFENQHTMFD